MIGGMRGTDEQAVAPVLPCVASRSPCQSVSARAKDASRARAARHPEPRAPRPTALAARSPVMSQTPTEQPARNMAAAKFTRKEIANRTDALIIDNVVYDVSEFKQDHPGGPDVLMANTGKDASQCFFDVGHSDIALEWRKDFVLGEVVDEDRWPVMERPAAPQEAPEPLTLSSLLNVWAPPLAVAALAALLYTYVFQ
ncbi:hypothetical protein PYW07_006800 [Mythimna separata]|uniref:Cytochrome b5 n=1 Tax=Mythimna separata TaxID=271217 RepID=A0AAD7Z1M9_MYTSE|nr:hypothetical protein PYW07_006800 [Mythimna separata]